MAAYRLPQRRHTRMRRGRPGAHRPRRRRVVPALQPAGAPRPHRRRGRLRAAAARWRPLAGLAGREGLRWRRDPADRGRRRRGAGPASPRRARRRGDGARPGPVGARVAGPAGTVAGRADELCRYAVLFGDPQLALTAVSRVLDVTAEEVQAVAAARLRPDNRAVLVYEPVTSEERPARPAARPVQPTRTTNGTEPAGDRRSRDHGLPPPAGGRAAEALGLPRARARRPRQRADRAALPPPRPAGRRRRDLPGRAAGRRARPARRRRHDHVRAPSPRAPTSTPPRSSPPSWSAAAPHSTRTPTTRARESRWRCPSPACLRRSGCSPTRCRRPRSPSSEIERLVRNRLDEIPHEMANPGAARRQGSWRRSCSRRPRGCPGRARAPRRPSPGSTRRPYAPSTTGPRAARHGDRGRRRRPDGRRPGRGARRHARRLDRRCRRAARPCRR